MCVHGRVCVAPQVSRGLWKKYGDKRIIDTPISEVRTFADGARTAVSNATLTLCPPPPLVDGVRRDRSGSRHGE